MTVIRKSKLDKILSVVNKLLMIAILAINGYVIFAPFFPQASFVVSNVTKEKKDLSDTAQRADIDRSYDHLVIPAMGLDEKIWVGENEKLVNKGIWQIPHTSTPDKGSNTVLVGHRFTYKNTAVLYHLDKVNRDDYISVAWQGKIYTYKVSETKVVKPTDVYIEDPTEDSILTVYTCNPVWSTRERLVVIAKLESVD